MYKLIVKLYTKHLENLVEKYCNIYHFDMEPNHTSYNNEGDAFKHFLMQAELSLFLGQKIAEWIGIKHEDNNPYNTEKERNMDLWNNREGRKVAKYIKQNKFWFLNLSNTYYLMVERIMIKLNAGELITDINDERKYK